MKRTTPILLLSFVLSLFVFESSGEANRVKKVKNKGVTKTVKSKRRMRHNMPKWTGPANARWANQYGHGFKSVLYSIGNVVRQSTTYSKDGTLRTKSENAGTGETTTHFLRGDTNVSMTRQRNGDWVRKRTTKSGLFHVTSNLLSKSLLHFHVPNQIGRVKAIRIAKKIAKRRQKPVELTFSNGARGFETGEKVQIQHQ